ncbi:MAG: 4-(cytidine 5'-diphospho)-2-C-methyl-D-erythritol kinase [Methyloligellaceae bacterium]
MNAKEVARAKVNLTLEILGRRPDGYHEVSSLVLFADVGDVVSYDVSKSYGLEIIGPFATELTTDNLIHKAVDYMQRKFRGLECGAFKLEKFLPVAAGLGGGSANAAAALNLIADAHNLELSPELIVDIAFEIGADVPVCLVSAASHMTGIGEQVAPLAKPLAPLSAVLVNPGIALSTAEVFAALDADNISQNSKKAESSDLASLVGKAARPEDIVRIARHGTNSLQSAAEKLRPEIKIVIEALEHQENCLLARMTGSGMTVFGLFRDVSSANSAMECIRSRHPDWWVRSVVLS